MLDQNDLIESTICTLNKKQSGSASHTSKTDKPFSKQKRKEDKEKVAADIDICRSIDQMRLPELYKTKGIYKDSLLDLSLKALQAAEGSEERKLYEKFKKKKENDIVKIQAEIDKLKN